MKKIFPLIVFLSLSAFVFGQQSFSRIIPPKFPGGKEALKSFIRDNMQYPEEAKQLGKEMDVRLSIKVDKEGKIFEVTTPEEDEYGFVSEAVRLVEIMPDWEPATKGGNPIATRYSFYVDFDLNPFVAKEPKKIEKLPSFPGGNKGLRDFLIEELNYPAGVDSTLAGAVVLQVKIDENGTISDRKVVKTLGQPFTEEAYAALDKMPAWEPGIADGTPTAMWFSIPFPFTTNENEKEATEFKVRFEESKETIEAKGEQTYTKKDTIIYFERKPLREVDTTYKQSENYIPPSFTDMESFIDANMVYPRKAKKQGKQGTVLVKIRVNEKGKVILSEIVQSQGDDLDAEALRLIKYMKNWNPATDNGKAIPDFTTIPIEFVLPK